VHARITASEARTPPAEESRVTSLGGLRPNVAMVSAEALKTEDLDLPVRENTVSLLSGLVKDMEPNSDMKLRLNEAAQLLAPKQLVTGVIRRSCEATTSGYFGIKRTEEVKCPYCPISLVLGNCQRDLEIRLRFGYVKCCNEYCNANSEP